MRGVAFDIHECVVWFLFFFYGGQYSEQTAARAEISAETPRGIKAARTRYHMLLQRSHGEDEEDEEESWSVQIKTYVKSSQTLREWNYGVFFNLSVYIFIGSNKKTCHDWVVSENKNCCATLKSRMRKKKKICFITAGCFIYFLVLMPELMLPTCCAVWEIKEEQRKKTSTQCFCAIHLVFRC